MGEVDVVDWIIEDDVEVVEVNNVIGEIREEREGKIGV